jgi:thioredoxin 1
MLTLTDSNFQKEVLESKDPVLVDFWAPWCGPCKIMSPLVEALDKEYEGKPIKFGKMNVDENDKTPPRYGIMSIPTFIIFKSGKPVEQFVGVQRKEDFKKKIDGLLK